MASLFNLGMSSLPSAYLLPPPAADCSSLVPRLPHCRKYGAVRRNHNVAATATRTISVPGYTPPPTNLPQMPPPTVKIFKRSDGGNHCRKSADTCRL